MTRLLFTLGFCTVAIAQACGVDEGLFSEAGSGAGGTTTASDDDDTSSSSGGGDTSTTSSTGGAPSTSSTGGAPTTSSTSTGGGTNCAHDVCDEGAALANGCDDCVTQICQSDAFCCTNQWDQTCVEHVWTICGKDCAPGEIACDAQYQFSPGYNMVCTQEADECELAANITIASCNTICQTGGGECLGAHNDDGSGCGFQQNPALSCNSMNIMSAVCHCSRGCGQGPPCSINQDCINGQCQ